MKTSTEFPLSNEKLCLIASALRFLIEISAHSSVCNRRDAHAKPAAYIVLSCTNIKIFLSF
jgi:hypothetical protein